MKWYSVSSLFPLCLGALPWIPHPTFGIDPIDSTVYFPLEVGNRWIYEETESGQQIEASITGREGEIATMKIGGTEVRLRDGQSEIDLELPEEDFVPYYLFQEDSWLHRDFNVCDDNRTMTVLSRNATVSTPAGIFHNCLDIGYMSSGCLDAGTYREWWAPDLGRIKWREVNFTGEVAWELSSFQLQTSFEIEYSSYFPLEAGNTWTYAPEDPWYGTSFSWKVIERTGDLVTLERPPGATHDGTVILRDRSSEIDIRPPEKDFLLFYRFDSDTKWIHHEISECDKRMEVAVLLEEDPVVTPAGVFHNCLRIERREGTPCPDNGTMVEWFAPGVGLVKWEELNFFAGGPITIWLEELSRGESIPEFQRGDANGDGSTDISDAIHILSFLFLSGTANCVSASDVDDTDEIDVSDIIYLVTYLFLNGAEPHQPFPDCGVDTTPREFTCETTPCIPE